MFPHGTGFVLVFEYMLTDLSEVSAKETYFQGYAKRPNGLMSRPAPPPMIMIMTSPRLRCTFCHETQLKIFWSGMKLFEECPKNA